ncbi:MAG: hypothetical protein AB9915_03860 [Candidatus Dojkabacteria bacterium]
MTLKEKVGEICYQILQELNPRTFVGKKLTGGDAELIFVGEERKNNLHIVLPKGRDSLLEGNFQEVFPVIMDKYVYTSYKLYRAKNSKGEFLLIYHEVLVEDCLEVVLEDIYEVIEGDVVLFTPLCIVVISFPSTVLRLAKEEFSQLV